MYSKLYLATRLTREEQKVQGRAPEQHTCGCLQIGTTSGGRESTLKNCTCQTLRTEGVGYTDRLLWHAVGGLHR